LPHARISGPQGGVKHLLSGCERPKNECFTLPTVGKEHALSQVGSKQIWKRNSWLSLDFIQIRLQNKIKVEISFALDWRMQMRFQLSGKQRKREMKIPLKEAQEGLPVPEDQYQERFWLRSGKCAKPRCMTKGSARDEWGRFSSVVGFIYLFKLSLIKLSR